MLVVVLMPIREFKTGFVRNSASLAKVEPTEEDVKTKFVKNFKVEVE
jgi:hypothetical protein